MPRCRLLVCGVLIPFLALSSLSFEVQITHVHADGALHTHVSRVFDLQDAHHQHGDGSHHHPCLPIPGGQQHEPGCCGVGCESTVILSSAGTLIRQSRDSARQLVDHLHVDACVGSMPPVIHDAAGRQLDRSFMTAPNSIQALSRTVLLI